jgi:hypothetical protein
MEQILSGIQYLLFGYLVTISLVILKSAHTESNV